MTQSKNNVIISAAGSGKTTSIVNAVCSDPAEKTLILSYTINNVQEVKNKFYEKLGAIPANTTISSWFSFLLHQMIHPYQNFVYEKRRIDSIFFSEGQSTQGISKENFDRYFLSSNGHVYTDKIAELAIICNKKSGELVTGRLCSLFDHIYIDEIQDLHGYDLDVLEMLFDSNLKITLVGDHRQATYQTNASPKNKKFSGAKIIKKFEELEKKGKCKITYSQSSYRCNQSICNFADAFYPSLPQTTSLNNIITGHDGLFVVHPDQFQEYMKAYNPKILRYDRRTNCLGYDDQALNWGDSKGLTFDRVLIFPHGKLKKYLANGKLSELGTENKLGSIPKLYVAITRARFSVALLFDKSTPIKEIQVLNGG